MDYFSIDYLIICAFLIITLIIGLRAGRGIKDIREYAVANKEYGLGILTITFLATYLEGNNIIGTQKSLLTYGLIVGLPPLGSIIMFIGAGLFLLPKMERFEDSLTIGDVMTVLYGRQGGMITGIMGSFFTICAVGAQIVAVGHICDTMLGWSAQWSIGFGGLLLVTYASIGGVKSVTLTDVFQFIIFIVLIPLIANMAISEVGGIKALFKQLPADKLAIYSSERFYYYLSTFLFWCLFPAVLSSPAIIQRILMAQSRQQAAHMLFMGAAITLVVRTLILLTGLSVIVLAPEIKPTSGGAFNYILAQYFSPYWQTVGAVGMLAVLMSTIDSVLNAGGLLLTHNVLKPLCEYRQVPFQEFKVVRFITFLVGVISILAALGAATEIRTLGYLGVASFVPVVTTPLVIGILGLQTDRRTFIISSIVTVSSFAVARVWLSAAHGYLLLPISIFANAISFFGAHYYCTKADKNL